MHVPFGTAVPLCDLQAQYRELRPQIEEAVARVLASGLVILGPEVAALEEEVAHYCGAAHAVGCAREGQCFLDELHGDAPPGEVGHDAPKVVHVPRQTVEGVNVERVALPCVPECFL